MSGEDGMAIPEPDTSRLSGFGQLYFKPEVAAPRSSPSRPNGMIGISPRNVFCLLKAENILEGAWKRWKLTMTSPEHENFVCSGGAKCLPKMKSFPRSGLTTQMPLRTSDAYRYLNTWADLSCS